MGRGKEFHEEPRRSVLLVDDEPSFLLSASVTLRSAGIQSVLTLEDSREVLPLLEKREVAAVVVDLSMPHFLGTELLERIKQEHPRLPVIVLTGRNEVDTAVACMKTGAFDYLVKPVESARFVSCIKRVLEMSDLMEELSSLKRHILDPHLIRPEAFSGILTASRKMNAIFKYVEAVAPTGQPVLITGETGVGKELFARAVHELSGRKGVFLAVNVAGLEDTVFSDTLFGHRKGAYTGADQAREGLIAQAAGGTIFLDEIGDMKESSQLKLLRLIEEKEYYPLGSDLAVRSDARVVCSTHQDMRALTASGRFRKDFYYRLSTHHLHIPPLRERLADLPMLVDHFLEEAARSLGRKKSAVPKELVKLLSTYHFPGNLRELRKMVFDAVAQNRGGILSMESFRREIGEQVSEGSASLSPFVDGFEPFSADRRLPTFREAEDILVAEALRRAGNNQGIAAGLLGITRQALNKRIVRKRDAGEPSRK